MNKNFKCFLKIVFYFILTFCITILIMRIWQMGSNKIMNVNTKLLPKNIIIIAGADTITIRNSNE